MNIKNKSLYLLPIGMFVLVAIFIGDNKDDSARNSKQQSDISVENEVLLEEPASIKPKDILIKQNPDEVVESGLATSDTSKLDSQIEVPESDSVPVQELILPIKKMETGIGKAQMIDMNTIGLMPVAGSYQVNSNRVQENK